MRSARMVMWSASRAWHKHCKTAATTEAIHSRWQDNYFARFWSNYQQPCGWNLHTCTYIRYSFKAWHIIIIPNNTCSRGKFNFTSAAAWQHWKNVEGPGQGLRTWRGQADEEFFHLSTSAWYRLQLWHFLLSVRLNSQQSRYALSVSKQFNLASLLLMM